MTRCEFSARKSPFVALVWLVLAVCQFSDASAANRPPVISGTPPTTATVGTIYSFTPKASDPEGRALTFSIKNKPSWAYFSTSTGRLRGTPQASHVGTYSNIVISAYDGATRVSLPAFSIAVKSTTTNRAPVISGTPPTKATVGLTYSFTPTASDPEGQPLTFSIRNKPAWAYFSVSTGRLRGTPTASHVGTYSSVVITVSDGTTSVSLPAFSIAVNPTTTNRAPVISGTPAKTATVRQPYSFRPTASDADGDRLTFSITNKPAWATFDSSNGTLYGTPPGTGTFANIAITVSDGKASTSLAAFTVTVAPASTNSVTLSWMAPTTNTDGTPLVAVAGFRVFYGTAPGNYSRNLSIASPAVTSVVIEGLESGYTWYFAVTAIGGSGAESAYSREVSKTLP
jgi:hypothetical protein